jgi:two-component system, cell cycle sensor histidine kinase PleC
MSPIALKQRVEARDRLVTQAELLGLQLHDELLGALARGDLQRAEETARRNDGQIRALTENLRVYQAELRAQAEELAAAQDRTEQVLTRFAALFAGMPVAALLVGNGGELVEFNAAAAALFGLDGRNAASRFLHRLVEPAHYQDRVAPALHEARASGASRLDEIEFRSTGGTGAATSAATSTGTRAGSSRPGRFIGEMHIARLPGLTGPGQFAVAIIDRSEHIEDVRALKAAHDALTEREAFLSAKARLARMGGFTLDRDSGTMQWSDKLRELFEFDSQEPAHADALLELCRGWEHRERLAAALAGLRRGEGYDITIEVLSARGRPLHLRAAAEPQGQRPGQAIGVFQDVSALAESRQRIEALDVRLAVAMDAGGVGTWWWHADDGHFDFDDVGRRLLQPGGVALADALGSLQWQQLRVALAAARTGGAPLDVDLQLAGEPPRILHLSGRVQPETAGPGVVLGCVRDCTAERTTARALAAQESAESANQAKSQFLSRMSHELRTPLNAILGFAQLMRMEAEAGDLTLKPHRVALIETAARHLLDLVNEVLDVSRIEAGRMEVQLARADLRELVRESLPMVQGLADKGGIALIDGLSGGPEMPVLADRLRLKEVLINLLSNAVKYNRPGGRVLIDARPERSHLLLRVRDTGIGLTQSQIASLFQPFNRAGAERTAIEGSGMGLFVSRRFVELMGGQVEVESTPGEGTLIVVRLNTPAV